MTGRRCTKSAGTNDPAAAEAARVVLEEKLNEGRPISGHRDNNVCGFVYLVRSPHGRYKIGKSFHPERRLASLNIAADGDLVLVHRIQTDDMGWLERFWHDRFAAQRVRGEWFDLTEVDVARFAAVAIWNKGKRPAEAREVSDPWYGLPEPAPSVVVTTLFDGVPPVDGC